MNPMDKPTGNVTFLFTDIEGSTKLSQEFPDNLPHSLKKHHRILNKAVKSNNGFVFEIVGDAFCCAFQNADDAVKAAVDAQINLAKEKWKDAVIKVRIGIHSGSAEWNGKGYSGYITLARAARVMSVAYGEQIIISNNTYDLCRDQFLTTKKGNISFRDLGERRLKDVIQPLRLFQVISPAIREDFHPLKTLDARPNNLPVQLTSFVGRESEMKKVKDLLKKTRLLTFTGSGGAGKTRLALQAAADVIDDFANGVWLVELASLSQPDLLPQTIMKTLSITEEPKRNPEDTLAGYLLNKEILVILDNCEHLIDACSNLAEKLLSICPKLKVISTGREALRCSGERTYQVSSLKTPNPKRQISPGKLSQFEAVRLFNERALEADESFRVDKNNAQLVAEICFQLDGIPLAIELAAARVKIMSVEQIHGRLNDRFNFLTEGKRTALPRQQTLRALIDWSYDLLSEEEKILWNRLSVFSGGWTLDAAEEICSDGKIKKERLFEVLNKLTEKSIIIFESGNERYRILETLRQYGEEKLKGSNEAAEILSAHLNYFTRFAEMGEPKLNGRGVHIWLEKLEAEHSNLQSAIESSVRSGNIEAGARLAGALGSFWNLRGYYSTGYRLLDSVLKNKNENDISKPIFIKALNSIGTITRNQGEYDRARTFFEKSLALSREGGDKTSIAGVLNGLGKVTEEKGDFKQARVYYEESLALSRETGDKFNIAVSLNGAGTVALFRGQYELAQNLYEESLALRRETGDIRGIANSLHNLGVLADSRGDSVRSRKFHEESLKLRREINDKPGITGSLNGLGKLAQDNGDYQKAREIFEESLILKREIGDKAGIANTLNNLGIVANDQEKYEESRKFYEESLSLNREINDKNGIATALNNLGNLELNLLNYEQAEKLFKESFELESEMGKKHDIANSLQNLGNACFLKGDLELALKFQREGLILFRELGEKSDIILSLAGMAGALSAGNPALGAILFGAVESDLKFLGIVLTKDEKKFLTQVKNKLQEKINNGEFLKYSEEGKKLTIEEAAGLALS